MRTSTVIIACSILAVLLSMACASESKTGSDDAVEPLLAADDLTNLDAVRAALAKVTPRHASRASHFEAEGRQALASRRFDVATKALATAVLHEPTATRAYLAAAATARISRPREDDSATAAAKASDYQMAGELLDVAAALARDGQADAQLTRAIDVEKQCISRMAASSAAPDCETPQIPAPEPSPPE